MMQRQERTTYKCTNDYLAQTLPRRELESMVGKSHLQVNPEDRQSLITWSFEALHFFRIDNSVASIATSYFDRFMCTFPQTSSRARYALSSKCEFQLAFASCLIIAIKCHVGTELYAELNSKVICHDLYDQNELNEMEKNVLKALRWRLNGPSVRDFVASFTELLLPTAKSSDKTVTLLKEYSKAQTDISTMDYLLALVPRSFVAFASIISSMQAIDSKEFEPLDRLEFMKNISVVMGLQANGVKVKRVRKRFGFVVREFISSRSKCPVHATGDYMSSKHNTIQRYQLDCVKASKRTREIMASSSLSVSISQNVHDDTQTNSQEAATQNK